MKINKGIILAGGTGSRLGPLTKHINKHCLPCGFCPMIYHPISQMLYNGINEICIVSGLHHLSSVVSLLGSGSKFGCSFTYKVQDEAGGIAEALYLCKNFSGDDNIVVLLGDNIFGCPLNFDIPENTNAVFFIKEVQDPSRFGVAEVDHLKKLIDIEEKPSNPKSNLAVTGAYLYDKLIWEAIDNINRSERNELEISDANKYILRIGQVIAQEIDCWWSDAGTHESYIKVNKDIWNGSIEKSLDCVIEKMIKS